MNFIAGESENDEPELAAVGRMSFSYIRLRWGDGT